MIEFGAAVEQAERIIFRQGLLDYVFVFFFFQRTSGVDEASAGCDLGQGGAEDCELAWRQVGEIGGREAPFDFGIAGESAGAGAGDVGEDAVELLSEGEMLGVGGDDLDFCFGTCESGWRIWCSNFCSRRARWG